MGGGAIGIIFLPESGEIIAGGRKAEELLCFLKRPGYG